MTWPFKYSGYAKVTEEMKREALHELSDSDSFDIFIGYYHYYGITDNFKAIAKMKDKVQEVLFYWLNYRRQRESYTVNSFNKLLTV